MDNTNFVSRTKYEKDGSDFEDKINKTDRKIPDVSDFVKKTYFNFKITEVEGKIPSTSGLATKSALTAVENKINDVSGLATASALTAVENKIPDVTNLVTKTDFHVKLKDISDRVTKNKSKDLLLDNELKKIKTFNADYFEGRNYFEGRDGTQNMLVFQVKSEYFVRASLGNTERPAWKSKGTSNENFYYNDGNIDKKLTKPTHVSLGSDQYFFQDAAQAIASSVVNAYICYKLLPKTINSDNVFKNCLFGAINAVRPNNTKDPDNFVYSGWGIGFDCSGTFDHPEGDTAGNVLIFGVDMSGSVHASNKTQYFLVLRRGLIQLIENTTIHAEETYSPNFSAENKIFVLSLHYNGDNSFLFVNGQNFTQFKAKDSVFNNARVLTLGALTVPVYPSGANNRLSPKTTNDAKLYGNVYDFSVDYSPISSKNILKIHKYLMKKNGLI